MPFSLLPVCFTFSPPRRKLPSSISQYKSRRRAQSSLIKPGAPNDSRTDHTSRLQCGSLSNGHQQAVQGRGIGDEMGTFPSSSSSRSQPPSCSGQPALFSVNGSGMPVSGECTRVNIANVSGRDGHRPGQSLVGGGSVHEVYMYTAYGEPCICQYSVALRCCR